MDKQERKKKGELWNVFENETAKMYARGMVHSSYACLSYLQPHWGMEGLWKTDHTTNTATSKHMSWIPNNYAIGNTLMGHRLSTALKHAQVYPARTSTCHSNKNTVPPYVLITFLRKWMVILCTNYLNGPNTKLQFLFDEMGIIRTAAISVETFFTIRPNEAKPHLHNET